MKEQKEFADIKKNIKTQIDRWAWACKDLNKKSQSLYMTILFDYMYKEADMSFTKAGLTSNEELGPLEDGS